MDAVSRVRVAFGWYAVSQRVGRRFFAMNAFSGFGLPLAVQAAFGQTLPAGAHTRLLIGNAILGLAMVVMRHLSFTLVADRVFGHRDLAATTSLDRRGYLVGILGNAVTLGALPLLFLVLGGHLPRVEAPVSWSWLVPYALTVASFAGVGLLVGARAESFPEVALRANLAVIVAFAVCPVTYPVARAPGWIQPLVAYLPPTLGADLIAAGWSGQGITDPRLLALLAWTVLLGRLGWARVPWTDSGAI